MGQGPKCHPPTPPIQTVAMSWGPAAGAPPPGVTVTSQCASLRVRLASAGPGHRQFGDLSDLCWEAVGKGIPCGPGWSLMLPYKDSMSLKYSKYMAANHGMILLYVKPQAITLACSV
jgi:hypothetical protein